MNKTLMRMLSMAFLVFGMVSTAAAQSGGGTYVIKGGGALAVGIAAALCGLGDARAIAAACEGTARNPGAGGRIFTMLILGLALIETLVLFTLLAANQGW
jgi:F-type H+-transporting ATPase subunit c